MKFLFADQHETALSKANSYKKWVAAAKRYDKLSGLDHWKKTEPCAKYDYFIVRDHFDKLRQALSRGDDGALISALSEGTHGNLGGIGNPDLYQIAKFGTKQLITDYIEEICKALQHLAQVPSKDISWAQKLRFFYRASRCYGSSAMTFSGGGVYGNFHAGVAKALIEQNLLPEILSGSSAGSLIVGIIGTHPQEELSRIFSAQNLRVETRRALRTIPIDFIPGHPRLKLPDITSHIERLVPDLTFQEAYELTGMKINISISPADLHQQPRLLNAETSPEVYIRSAILASCAIPGIFPAVVLKAKNIYGEVDYYMRNNSWVDGSLTGDIPTKRLSRLYGTNHYIVSQVNPFALPANISEKTRLIPIVHEIFEAWHHSAKASLMWFQSIITKYEKDGQELRYLTKMLTTAWLQEYEGNINIHLPLNMVKPWKGLSDISIEELMQIIKAGEKATWPKIEMIRNCTKIDRTLKEVIAIIETKKRKSTASLHTITRAPASSSSLHDSPSPINST